MLCAVPFELSAYAATAQQPTRRARVEMALADGMGSISLAVCSRLLSGGGYTRLAGECARSYGAAPAAVYGLGPPATDLVKLPKAARRERDALLAAEKDRHRAKQARQSASGGRRRALH